MNVSQHSSTRPLVVAFDCETFLIGPGAVLPKMVCASFAWRNDNADGGIETALFGNSPVDELPEKLLSLLTNPDVQIVTHNGSFDYGVTMASYPQLTTPIFEALLSGRCTDTRWREKLLNLSTTGKLDSIELPDGSRKNISYSLAALAMDYLDIDISEDKEGEDAWRTNYNVLDGWEAADYPEDAARYARADAELTLRVYEAQEERKARAGNRTDYCTTTTEQFQLASAFALHLMTAWGTEVDHEKVAEMRVALEAHIEETSVLLVKHKLLTPAVPSKPMMRGGKPVLDRKAMKAAGTDEPIQKMTAPKAEKRNMKAIQDYVRGVYKRLGVIPELTDGGKKAVADGADPDEQPIKIDAEVQEFLATKDEVMAQYHERMAVQKIVGQQLPVLESGTVIHPNFDVLKETGRTSSYGGGKKPLYPSTNIQQVPKVIRGFDARACYRPRAGTVFFDVDYTALELACVGQITYDLFGESVHLTRYNEGYDLHAYLGSQLAIRATDGVAGEFAQACRAEGILDDPVQVYEAFKGCKGSDREDLAGFFKHYRNFAKPVGLGFPGGLGAATMVDFARKTYKVDLTEEQAGEFKEMWLEVYPEMGKFFEWVNAQQDDFNEVEDSDDWKTAKLYWYVTPYGMVRRGASFCAAANGKSMQAPGAEGFKTACIRVQRECYDPSMESVLFGCRPTKPIHDQIVGETTTDASLWHDQAMRVRDIMCESMKGPLPDINMRSDEAHLTRVWSKESVPVFGDDGRLIPWEPK